jgi:hypothetical protein
MKSRFALFILILPTISFSQESLALKGKALDEKLKLPLPLAIVSVKNSSIGTMTNEAGEFELHVPAELKNDTLTISYLGYNTFRDRVSNFKDYKVIFLVEEPTHLKEITVTSDGARKLVELALKAIPRVCPNTPYLMEGFHRSWEKMETDSGSYPGTLIEAAVTIYDPGYLSKKNGDHGKEEIYLNEVRRSLLMKGWDYGSGNGFRYLLNKNLVRYNRAMAFVFLKSFFDFPNNLIYEWAGTTKMDGEDLSIIRVEIPNARKFPAYYEVYISETDNAILRFDVFGEKTEIDYSIGPWHTDKLIETYIFKRYQCKPYLSYSKTQYTIKRLDQKQKKVLRTEDYFREFQVNNIVIDEVEGKRKALASQKSKEVSLALQAKSYNESFWKSYNVILDNPLDKEIVKFFEGHDKTFKKRSKD